MPIGFGTSTHVEVPHRHPDIRGFVHIVCGIHAHNIDLPATLLKAFAAEAASLYPPLANLVITNISLLGNMRPLPIHAAV